MKYTCTWALSAARSFATHKPMLAASLMVVYLILEETSFIHPLHDLNITPWNPQRSLLVAAMFVFGWIWVPWVYLTTLVAEAMIGSEFVPPVDAAMRAAALTLGYGLIAYLLRTALRIEPDLASQRDVLRLAGAVMLGAAVTAVLYVGVLLIGATIELHHVRNGLFRLWLGDTVGMLVTLPLALLLIDRSRRAGLARLICTWPMGARITLTIASMGFVFSRPELEQAKYFYVLFLPVIWIAARDGLAGAIVALIVVQAGIVATTLLSGHQTLTVIELQTLLLALALTGHLLGATVDELTSASERLARARQLTLASEMATAMAHELNQPLTALSTYADVLGVLAHSDAPDKTVLAEASERIRRVATRSAEIVRRFRSIGAPKAERSDPVNLVEVLDEVVAVLRERAAREGIAIEKHVSGPLPTVRLDRERMRFVLQNLLANAMDAVQDQTADARRIGLSVRMQGRDKVEVVVVDSGSGVPFNMVDKIFEPFFTSKAKGMGLGLAISRSIVESHGGRIWAEPADRGIFHVILPI